MFLNSIPFSRDTTSELVGVEEINGFLSMTSKTFLALIKALRIVGTIGMTLPKDIIDI